MSGVTEQALKDSHRLLQRIIDSIEGEVFVKDANGKYLFVNKAFGRDFGVDPKDVIGKDDYSVFPPEAAAKLQENDQRIMAGKEPVNIEESGMLKGKYVTYLTNKVPLIDEDGKVFGICGVGFDITRQREMEEELRKSEQKYQNLVKNSHDIVYSVRSDGIITFIGPQIARFGYLPEDLLSKNYIEYVAPEQRQRVVKSFEQGTKDGTSLPTEFQFLGKDGERHWVEAVGKVLYDDSGSPSLQVGVLRDIAERKRAEEALRQAHEGLEKMVEERTAQLSETVKKLREAEWRYRTVADFTYNWEYWANLDGTMQYVSPSCERISGYPPRQFIDNPSLFKEIILPEDREIWDTHYRDSRKGFRAREIQFRIQTRDGKIRWIEHVCQPVTGDQGDVLGFRASNRDITRRKKGEIELRNAYSEIEALKSQLEADFAYLGEEIKVMHDYENIIGESEVFKYVLFSLEQIAPTDTTVLILGESGTGKELIARAIHHGSRRKERPLVKVDCAALPANLIESELFGHERGAFTGAIEKRIGRFELADGATIFLDEIGELPLELQQKLLRVLEHGEFERLGSSRMMHTDVRVIAATNRDLKTEVRRGRFREDLWYRLNVFPLSIPPLRDRKADIPLLAHWMVHNAQRRLDKNIKTIPAGVMNELKAYAWPGNVRELQNVIERAVIVTPGSRLQLGAHLKSPESDETAPPHHAPMKSLEEMEKEYILEALQKTHWNISGKGGAAELLGLNSSTLRGRMRKHGIRRPSYQG